MAARLRVLVGSRLLQRERTFQGESSCYRITRRGLAAVGSSLPAPRMDLQSYDHDIGLAWLWLAARNGKLGEVREIVSERTMRSQDGASEPAATKLGVRLGGLGSGGRPRLHYPDLLLRMASGHQVAVELELSGKTRARREKILMGYAADRRIDAVLYLVERRSVGREVAATARKLGISSMVQVQLARRGESGRRPQSGLQRRPTRMRPAQEAVPVQ